MENIHSVHDFNALISCSRHRHSVSCCASSYQLWNQWDFHDLQLYAHSICLNQLAVKILPRFCWYACSWYSWRKGRLQLYMNFDVFCPVVCRCLCLDVVQDSHNVKRPKSDMEHWPIQIISNNPNNMLASTSWRPSSQIHPDDLAYIFSLALAPVNPQQTTFSDEDYGM